MTRGQLADTFRRISAHHPGYASATALDIWVAVWTVPARRFDWQPELVAQAIDWFYDGDPITWAEGPFTGEPRPILPRDINDFAEIQDIP